MKKVWLASFPRSGNTYFRNILFHVYGINSYEDEKYLDGNCTEPVFIKTHELPFRLQHYNRKTDKVIYLVRDGRDSICSLAFKRKNIIAPESDLDLNFKEAILAEQGSFFGGWSKNILFWQPENPLLIRFEELTQNPQKVFENQIEPALNISGGQWHLLPTFDQQKKGNSQFGYFGLDPDKKLTYQFFRKGKANSWQEDLKPEHQQLFLTHHGSYLNAFGYTLSGELGPIVPAEINKIKKNYLARITFRIKLFYWNLKIRVKELIGYGV